MKRFLLALTALLTAASLGEAATTTTEITLASDAYTDLGVGPMKLGASGGALIYRYGDSLPAASALPTGVVQPGQDSPCLQTTSHVYAKKVDSRSIVAAVSAGTGIASCGGGGGSTTLTGTLPAFAATPPVTLSPSASLPNSHAVTSALAASLVLKASAGALYSVNATGITGGAAGYLVVINATAAPSSGSAIAPLDFCYFGGAGGCSLSHSDLPVAYSTGIVALITTAANPYTFTSGVDTAAISGDYQ